MELMKKEKIKMNKNKDTIGTKLVLNLPKLEPVIMGHDVGAKLVLGLPPLKPILISDKTRGDISEKNPLVKKIR